MGNDTAGENLAGLYSLVATCEANDVNPLEYLRDVGEARSATEIEGHFSRNLGVKGVTTACEYLAAKGFIGKASVPVRLTKRSRVDVQELAFFHLQGEESDADLPPGARRRGRT